MCFFELTMIIGSELINDQHLQSLSIPIWPIKIKLQIIIRKNKNNKNIFSFFLLEVAVYYLTKIESSNGSLNSQ